MRVVIKVLIIICLVFWRDFPSLNFSQFAKSLNSFLDTLTLGTSVVAYDIPAIRFVYQGLKLVKIIREFDVSSMTKVANRVMRMSDEEYESEHDNKEFLELHSSWANVARETHEFLSLFI